MSNDDNLTYPNCFIYLFAKRALSLYYLSRGEEA